MMTDLLIIGGGINGAGIAADAAGRGLSVILCEQNDLASGTSSKSSKLIHGGLRYLEYYEFDLVHKALKEREILLRKAPHLIRPLCFVMPYLPQLRPRWLIRLGLFFYDHLSKRHLLPGSSSIQFNQHAAGKALKPEFKSGFVYSDCFADDARLVILNAYQARKLGAQILTRTQVIGAERHAHYWDVQIKNKLTGEINTIQTKTLINATGAWIEDILKTTIHIHPNHHIKPVKGSHIVVPQLYEHEYAYILQNIDKRIIFVIPYLGKYSLIGTTDVLSNGDLNDVTISDSEINYLCGVVNRYFKRDLQPADILWTYAGVRPLLADGKKNISATSRDYLLELNDDRKTKAPLLNIWGGKITTYRELAEESLKLLKPYYPDMNGPWTADLPLPGGNIENANFSSFSHQLQSDFPWLPRELTLRYAHNYGTLTYHLLENATSLKDLGKNLGANLYQREIVYLVKYEWAQTPEDILWRRTKLGLEFPKNAVFEIDDAIFEKNHDFFKKNA